MAQNNAKEVQDRINNHAGEEIALYSGDKIQIKFRMLSPQYEQEAIFHKLHNMGYKLKRFGEYSTGTEFAEFEPYE